MLCDVTQGGIRYQGNFPDVLLVVPHEAEVRHQGSLAIPPGELERIDDQPRQASGFFNVRVGHFAKLRKIALLEGGPGSHVQNGLCRVECEIDHVLFL